MSDSEDLSSFSALSLGPPEISSGDYEVLDEDKVCNSSIKSGNSKQQSSNIIIQTQDNDEIEDSLKKVEIEDSVKVELDKLSSDKCFSKCATFPCSAGSKYSDGTFDGIEEQKGDSTPHDLMQKGCATSASSYTRSVSLPTPVKLVSALKGSREKLGAPPRNLTVKWAPDVYDPIPTSASHVPNRKPQRYNKRNGKNKQKGSSKASRGKGKEKKQSRKSGGSSTKHYKLADNESSGAWYGNPQPSILEFGVGCPDPFGDSQGSEVLSGGLASSAVDFGVTNPDPFCGHSFLKKSVASMHFPVTEAT
ncbi:OLC1v1034782C1 [Oldenlandia corymbosa var. corymbosa]|uniref:OLC1v1034782C1 n=1 Tax=Oldenlandia corymbosa var. corymbosa TaxID=529605 RepID=A0AAV1CSR5_OLDCO|nr:OLC1v1034782C1 [Oldenlandia corymbosa var. corymbosa]